MAINEIQRQAYLEAMGIQSYFPRYVLPAARPSRQCEWPEQAAPALSADAPPSAAATARGAGEGRAAGEAAAKMSPAPPARGRPAAGQLRETPERRTDLNEVPRQTSGGMERAQARPVQDAGAGEAGGEIRFRLAFIRAGEGLCVLNQLPQAGAERLGARHRTLLQGLLAGFLPDGGPLYFEEAPFRWPFAEGAHVAKGRDAARQALNAYLQQQAANRPFRVLLMMGEAVAPCVTGAAAIERGRLLEAAGGHWRVLVTRSLDEMLRVPALKRDVWRDLRALA